MTTKHERRRDDTQRPQDRPDRRLLMGAATLVLLLLGACDGGGDAPTADQPPVATGAPEEAADTTAEEIATGFVEAYGAFDVEQAITYLADDALISELMTSVGAQGVEGTQEEFRLLISLLEAQGYKQMLNSCEETGSSASGTRLRCTFDFHLFGSDQIGLGPYSGGYFDVTALDGEIVRASQYFETEEFSPQMWEPFADWVSTTYPEDAAVMYTDETYSGVQLTEESVRLWGRHVPEYVEEAAS